MATINNLSSVCMCGNPIVVTVTANAVEGSDDHVLSFHRLVIDVTVQIADADEKTAITQSFATSVSKSETVQVDISSALRAVADSIEYSASPTGGKITYPVVAYHIEAHDEYRMDGDTYSDADHTSLEGYYYAFNGAFSDLERLKGSEGKAVTRWTRKPKTSPMLACVGETIPYSTSTFDYSTVTSPTVQFKTLTETDYENCQSRGAITVGDFKVYVLPAAQRNDDRYEFRFINGLGVLDSFSCYALAEFDAEMESTEYALTTLETFGSMSHGIVHKTDDKDQIKLTSGPLTKDWQDWFIHEFLKAEYMWVYLRGAQIWVRCNVSPSDTVKGMNRAKTDVTSIDFTCKLDINGSMNANLMA